MAYIGNQPALGNFVKLDAIVTSATATYNLLNGGVAFSPASANQCIVSLNGVIQEPTSASNVGGFTISGSTIVFTSALTSLDVIDFILVLGDVLNIGTPSDSTVGFAKVTSNLITGATAETTIAGGDTILLFDDSASALRKMTRTNFVSGLTNTPAFRAYASGTLNPSNDTFTKLQINTEDFDTDSNYDPTTNFRFTPTTAGKYFVYAQARFDGSTGNLTTASVQLRKNGSGVARGSFMADPGDAVINIVHVNVASIIDFNGSSDYVEAFCLMRTFNGSGINVEGGSEFTFFSAYKLIGV